MIKGGEFLIKETLASEIFTPEDWSEEQKRNIRKYDEMGDSNTPNPNIKPIATNLGGNGGKIEE